MLSAVLKRAGHQTSLLHITSVHYSDEDFRRDLEREAPDLLAVSCTTFAFRLGAHLARLAKDMRPNLPNIFGGLHPTMSPEEVINTPGIDMLCKGEGEEAIVELCERLEAGRDHCDVANLWVNYASKTHRNPVRPVEQDLDSYPFADREIFNYGNLHHEQKGWGTFMMTRGCAFGCTYCANRTLMHLYRGQNYVRFRRPEKVAEEIKTVFAKYPHLHSVHFDDDLPFIKKDYTQEFCDVYKREVHAPFRFNLRPNLVFEEELCKLRDAGCTEAKIGLESGNEVIMNRVLDRALTVQQVEDAFHTANRAGIKTYSFNMVGLPDETPSAVLETVRLNARAKPYCMQVSIFFPFPGTPLWDLCKERGWLSEDVPLDYFSRSTLPLDTMTNAQVLFFHRRFHQLVRLYQRAYAWYGTGPNNWVVKLLDWTLTFEPTRRLWSWALRFGLPAFRSLRDRFGHRPQAQAEYKQYVGM
ncbi:MAG: B12-binding domain-containing radical SAM protein [Candidatus Hydrogenedentes bacterium]|nr:B12-binding domain-containing radical SAM protein [Candidatus Hydrogenedentota bacterium]